MHSIGCFDEYEKQKGLNLNIVDILKSHFESQEGCCGVNLAENALLHMWRAVCADQDVFLIMYFKDLIFCIYISWDD